MKGESKGKKGEVKEERKQKSEWCQSIVAGYLLPTGCLLDMFLKPHGDYTLLFILYPSVRRNETQARILTCIITRVNGEEAKPWPLSLCCWLPLTKVIITSLSPLLCCRSYPTSSCFIVFWFKSVKTSPEMPQTEGKKQTNKQKMIQINPGF